MKPKIKEIIVVEGKDDVSALKRAVDCDIVITHGLGLTADKIAEIRALAERRGIIVFTDPDFPGGKIRHILKDAIPNLKHAYINKDDARDPKTGKLGVEYASPEAILRSLQSAKAETCERTIAYSANDLLCWGLSGTSDASRRRDALCDHLLIGHTNAKQLLHKLNCYQIPREEITRFLSTVDDPPER